MADRLSARAGGVDIARLIWREDVECCRWETFGGDVDVRADEGSGGDEEEGLLEGPFCEVGWD